MVFARWKIMNFNNKIFNSAAEQKFFSWYRRFFSIEEIEQSSVLHWVFGAILLGFYVTFFRWNDSSMFTVEAVKKGTYICWPFFQNCGNWYFLSNLPYGYSQTTLYMFFFVAMVLIILAMWQKEWVAAHILMMILFIWEVSAMLLTMAFSANYWYFHLIYTFVLLFLSSKLFFLRFFFVLFYFLAGSVKIHEGWILGTYFTSLETGLPIIPNILAPLITNAVLFMEIVGSWFLLSNRAALQRVSLGYFLVFHLYSGILVNYTYPTIALPLLLILFGPLNSVFPPFDKKAILGWTLALALIIIQLLPRLILGDAKMTLEGNKFGLYMFEANHQCISTTKIYLKNGTIEESRNESASARARCDPYRYWFPLKQTCKRKAADVERMSWQFDHSINGGPFYRIVDAGNVCVLEYQPFRHNQWILLPENDAPIIGYPVKNFYY